MSACSDDFTVNIYNKKITQIKIPCMKLVVFPPNEKIESYLDSLYTFDTNCSYRLEVDTKSGITCNSNQNYQKKALEEFPTSYLKMQIKESSKLQYSYYKDIREEVEVSDVKEAIKRISEDLVFFSK
jgi:hypothetical protein